MASPANTIRIALDWTPNTLHAPLLLAKSLKYYEEAGLNVTFNIPSPEPPPDDTPARRLQKGEADLALCRKKTPYVPI
jgi:ABC-type nitrate/sulfonate/bicarbonate transport system substrate-binding protein